MAAAEAARAARTGQGREAGRPRGAGLGVGARAARTGQARQAARQRVACLALAGRLTAAPRPGRRQAGVTVGTVLSGTPRMAAAAAGPVLLPGRHRAAKAGDSAAEAEAALGT